MSVLLDASVVVDCLRRNGEAESYFRSLPSQPSVSHITVSEVLSGVGNRREEDDAEVFWSIVRPLGVDHDIARRARVFVGLYHASHHSELADAVIAATLERHGLPLATLNIKHFPVFARPKAPY